MSAPSQSSTQLKTSFEALSSNFVCAKWRLRNWQCKRIGAEDRTKTFRSFRLARSSFLTTGSWKPTRSLQQLRGKFQIPHHTRNIAIGLPLLRLKMLSQGVAFIYSSCICICCTAKQYAIEADIGLAVLCSVISNFGKNCRFVWANIPSSVFITPFSLFFALHE